MEKSIQQQEDNILQYKMPYSGVVLLFFSISSPELSEESGHFDQKKKLQQVLMNSNKETSSSLHM